MLKCQNISAFSMNKYKVSEQKKQINIWSDHPLPSEQHHFSEVQLLNEIDMLRTC